LSLEPWTFSILEVPPPPPPNTPPLQLLDVVCVEVDVEELFLEQIVPEEVLREQPEFPRIGCPTMQEEELLTLLLLMLSNFPLPLEEADEKADSDILFDE
jgi:hypothetical protein